MTSAPTILVVEDEELLADLYAEWLADEYTVKTAYSGEEALSMLDPEIGLVLLDRRMPGVSGDDVLETIRERELSCQVVMVTAVDPDFDVAEMAFDDYLVKPIDKDELRTVVETQLEVSSYDEQVQELFSLAAKIATLEAEKSEAELADSDEYQRLQERLEEVRSKANTTIEKALVTEIVDGSRLAILGRS